VKIHNNKRIIKFLFINILASSIWSTSSLAAADLLTGVNLPHTVISQAQSMMIEQNLLQNKNRAAIAYIDSELKKDPSNTNLLYKKAVICADIEQYDKALAALDQIAILQPGNEEALKLRIKIEKIILSQPRNELGLNVDEAYVSDVGGYWTYSTLHYYRFTQRGTFGARINYAKRYGTTGEQYQLEAYPTFPSVPYLQYIRLSAAYANFTQILFPNYQYAIEPYFNLPKNFEFSLGFSGLRSIGVNIYTYTGSLAYYWGNNYLWFRPYHYTPKSSDFFELGVRHYFEDKNTFISVKGGIGKAPDILDLAPLNQIIVLDQNLIAINGQFAMQKNLYLQAGAGYLRQVFPSGKVRNITDGSLGIIWQF
jgi:YaiO family outer membrane protein